MYVTWPAFRRETVTVSEAIPHPGYEHNIIMVSSTTGDSENALALHKALDDGWLIISECSDGTSVIYVLRRELRPPAPADLRRSRL